MLPQGRREANLFRSTSAYHASAQARYLNTDLNLPRAKFEQVDGQFRSVKCFRFYACNTIQVPEVLLLSNAFTTTRQASTEHLPPECPSCDLPNLHTFEDLHNSDGNLSNVWSVPGNGGCVAISRAWYSINTHTVIAEQYS